MPPVTFSPQAADNNDGCSPDKNSTCDSKKKREKCGGEAPVVQPEWGVLREVVPAGRGAAAGR